MGQRVIQQAFDRSRDKPLFIPFVTAGDPTLEATTDIVKTLEEAGADMIELGVPYSDPLADGPTIQQASQRALREGVNFDDVLQLALTIREQGVVIPILLFTYINPVLQYGVERMFQQFESCGIDGVIIPDLPVEESEDVRRFSVKYHKPLISLVAPTSEQRIGQIASSAEGFIYCVSSLGVTGTRSELSGDIHSFLDQVRQYSQVPIAVGFGISTPDQVASLRSHCDGIIVGSAIVRIIEQNEQQLRHRRNRKMALNEIKTFVKTLQSEV